MLIECLTHAYRRTSNERHGASANVFFIAFIVIGTCLFQSKDEQAMSATAQAPMWPRLRSFSSPKPSSCAPRINFPHPHSSQCVFQRTHCRDFGRSHHPNRAHVRPDHIHFRPHTAHNAFFSAHTAATSIVFITQDALLCAQTKPDFRTRTIHIVFFSAHTAATSVVLITQTELMCA